MRAIRLACTPGTMCPLQGMTREEIAAQLGKNPADHPGGGGPGGADAPAALRLCG